MTIQQKYDLKENTIYNRNQCMCFQEEAVVTYQGLTTCQLLQPNQSKCMWMNDLNDLIKEEIRREV